MMMLNYANYFWLCCWRWRSCYIPEVFKPDYNNVRRRRCLETCILRQQLGDASSAVILRVYSSQPADSRCSRCSRGCRFTRHFIGGRFHGNKPTRLILISSRAKLTGKYSRHSLQWIRYILTQSLNPIPNFGMWRIHRLPRSLETQFR